MTDRAILAKELMTTNLVTLSPEMDVLVAIQVLLKRRISGAPVVASSGEFLGVFSESSCMRVVINAAYDDLPDAGLLSFIDRDPPTVDPETDLLTICQTFLDQATRRLPVLDAGRLVGMVSRRDVMRKISDSVQGKRCGHAELLYLSAIHNDRKESMELRLAK
ncbi:MAG: CBS domain-containing protein [Pirellulaceae bacterium]